MREDFVLLRRGGVTYAWMVPFRLCRPPALFQLPRFSSVSMGSISHPDWHQPTHGWYLSICRGLWSEGHVSLGKKGCWSISAKTVNISTRQVHMGTRKSQNSMVVCEWQLHLLRLGLWGRQEAGLIAEEWEPGSQCGWKGLERIPSQYQHWIHWGME